MSIPASKPRKGMSDIKTLSGSENKDHPAYRTYLKLGTLEMQRLRKQKERDAAVTLIAQIDESLAQINNEISTLNKNVKKACQPYTNTRQDKKVPLSSLQQGFRLRY
ncbi:hypothetical protein [Spartinivicinus poritis]|uniref:Uncharacterized protein n=1 Tax=Spartinivicinus poritis TaxID=2994640 RepID=A0ABT5UH09_9GAMM|nr:hypothetical protein [Spartinivicinus sp. A2-2]MDE1465678.1 hypothetical protein [Spartinivicinus sp. A2-2]